MGDVADTRGRNYVAFTISKSLGGGSGSVRRYYTELLQRGVDSTGMPTWIPQMQGNGDVRRADP